MKRIVPIVVLCLGVGVASPAFCQKKKAKVLFDAGVSALERKDYAKALQSFQDAYEVSPHWAVLAHIGTCYMKMNQPQKAIDAFERYLDEGGNQISQDERKTAEDMIVQQKQKIGVLVLSVDKVGVEALVDGKPIGTSPFSEVVLTPGRHEVAVLFGENDIVKRDITLTPGQEFLLRIEQETHVSETPPPPPVQQATVQPEEDTGPEPNTLPEFSPPPSESPKKGSPVPFATALGITIADGIATGVAVGLFIYYTSSANNYQLTLNNMSGDPRFKDFTWEETCFQETDTREKVYYCNTEYNRREFEKNADTWKIVSIATGSVLAVSTALTIVFGVNRHWFGGSKGGETAAFSVLPLLGPNTEGIMLNVAF